MLFGLWKSQLAWLFDLTNDIINKHVDVKMTQAWQARMRTKRLCYYLLPVGSLIFSFLCFPRNIVHCFVPWCI